MKVASKDWITWIAATTIAAIVGIFTLMSYSHSTFATDKRVDRLESKIDRIIYHFKIK